MRALSGYEIGKASGLAYRILPGEGDAVLWLHGYTLDSSSWEDLWAMLPGWRHIGVDLPGHGASDPIPKGANLRDVGQMISAFCLDHHIRHIAGLSFGTIFAIQTSLELPDHFSSITLGAPALAGGPRDPEMARVYSEMIARFAKSGMDERLISMWLSSPAWKGIDKRTGLADALIPIVKRHAWSELASFASMLQFTYPPQKEEDLTRIRSPLMILIGEYEMECFRECATILRRSVAGASLHVLPETDHLCTLQSPEISAKWIASHLAGHAASRSPR
jgi:pimeloyl-ACP methyl ester carboxylesterase